MAHRSGSGGLARRSALLSPLVLLSTAAPPAGAAGAAAATEWPTRPWRLVVPFAAGGTSDLLARMLGHGLSPVLGQTVVVENRVGGGGTLAAAFVAQSPPDSYVLLLGTPGVQTTNPFMMPSLPYDHERGFTPVVNVMRTPNLLVVHPSVPANSVAELIALARARPGTLFFGSSGVGSTSHLAGELLRSLAGIEIGHVPFRGTGPNVQALLAGDIKMTLDGLPSLLPHVREGRLRLLAVTTPERYAALPEVPALAETLTGFDAAPFNYLAGPAGLPAAVVARLNGAVNGLLADAEFRRRFEEAGFEPRGGTPEDLAGVIRAEATRWRQVIQAAGIRVE